MRRYSPLEILVALIIGIVLLIVLFELLERL